MLTWAAQKIMGDKCACAVSVVKRRERIPCPGRAAAFFTLLRRAGTIPNASVRYGPGSAKHHAAKSGLLHRARDTKPTIFRAAFPARRTKRIRPPARRSKPEN